MHFADPDMQFRAAAQHRAKVPRRAGFYAHWKQEMATLDWHQQRGGKVWRRVCAAPASTRKPMKKILVRTALAASVFSVSVAMLAHATANAAASGPSVSKAVATPLMAAQKLMQSGDFQGALAQVKIAQALPDQTDFDTFQINEFLASVDISLKDYAGADVAMEAAADSPFAAQMTDATARKQLIHNALLLAGQAQHWSKVVAYEPQLDALGGSDDTTLAVTAQAYYFLKDNANAQLYAQKSIDAAKTEGKQPQQIALEIQLNGQTKTDQGAAEQTLENIAVSYNKPSDWAQLIDIGLSTKGMKNTDGLYFFRLRNLVGAMNNPDDYTTLGTLAEQLGYPAEARNVLQQGISSGKITAGQAGATLSKSRADAAADERMLPSIAAAAEKSKSGEQDVKLAEDYWGYGRYADAEAAAKRAAAKGGLKDPSEATMVMGMAQVAQGQYAEAQQTFAQVTGSAPRMKAAHLWSLYAKAKQGNSSATAPAH
jgi:hypothetical protein